MVIFQESIVKNLYYFDIEPKLDYLDKYFVKFARHYFVELFNY